MRHFHKVLGVVLVAGIVFMAGCGSSGTSTDATSPVSTEQSATHGTPAEQTASQQTSTEPAGQEETKTWKPEKAVTLIVPYSAGGSTDVLARVVEKIWPKYVDQPLTVVNQPGGSGWVGREAVAKAAPDGYTLMIGYGSGEDLIAPQLREAPFDPINDFQPIALLSNHAILFATSTESGYETMEQLLEAAKSAEVTAALSGVGNLMDITVRAVAKAAGVEITGVPFAGGGPATTAMVGNQVDFGPGHPSELMPHVKGGRLRILAVASPERESMLADVPTLKELGIDYVNAGSLKGIAAPAGLPEEILAYYEDLFAKITSDPEFQQAMADVYQPVNYKNPEEFGAMIREYYEMYSRLIKELDIHVE